MNKLYMIYIKTEEDYKKFCEEAKERGYSDMKPFPETCCPHCKVKLFPAIVSGLQFEKFETVSS